MVRRIYKLKKHIANKIAAGEVVDRPSSVVKELMENAIDAGALKITVEIKEGGKSYIRITDDGSGIHPSDIEVAFERHATSKIRDIEDLNRVISLGFRGEALASIVAVSQVELITKVEDSYIGTQIQIHGGEVIHKKEVGCPKGTTFIVKNLFYNVPARLKFLKSNTTETAYISDLVTKFSLAYPNISFRFINNGTIVFTTSGNGKVIDNIFNIYGKEIAQNMLCADEKENGVTLQGYISKPNISRGNKKLQVFFVNGRYVKNKMISEAIEEAYKTLTMVNRFPICFLYLQVDPNSIDVNIHPTKIEIRFDDPETIKKFIIKVLKDALFHEDLIPKVSFEKKVKKEEGHQERILDLPIQKEEYKLPPKEIPVKENFISPIRKIENTIKEDIKPDIKPDVKGHIKPNIKEDIKIEPSTKYIDEPVVIEDKPHYITNNKSKEEFQEECIQVSQNTEPKERKIHLEIKNIQIIGQIFNTYLIGQDGENMYLIDQHAAHERIMYEYLTNHYKNQSIASQNLLVPIVLELSYIEYERVKNNIDFFTSLGFDIDEFGVNTFMIRSVPMLFGEPEAKKFFMEALDHLKDSIQNSYDMKVEKIISMSCKKAIKAHDKLDALEIDSLMKQLSELENPYTCPHGRPVIVKMTQYEIERKFKRT
ncbi:DNA mismatch repair endonuclease MutL [Inediibacterium massiliense]|uniref:DNA mismatch repair endonuclease MutL n=1 Tax=Inediibacterium massiliense TaxID=1658111 RepID=UPI0006B66571|nr:DNA mismatch repair endonuclease MutL [Inediibacterium massiliense]